MIGFWLLSFYMFIYPFALVSLFWGVGERARIAFRERGGGGLRVLGST